MKDVSQTFGGIMTAPTRNASPGYALAVHGARVIYFEDERLPVKSQKPTTERPD